MRWLYGRSGNRRPSRCGAIRAAIAGLLAVGLAAPGCTARQLAGQSPSYLIVESLGAASGAQPGATFQSTLQSDVVTVVDGVPIAVQDVGQVVFALALKDSGPAAAPTIPSPANVVTLDRYHVEYLRGDGRHTPGVDVPYSFDGAFTATVGDGGATATFTLVRLQAKLEAPLRALAGGGGAVALSTVAEVTFYGTDQTGRDVRASGRIEVDFADWPDPRQTTAP
jgi:hypothetical protein